ncbi:MAG TPA: hypothetical protein VGZ69_03465 [Candidatus Rhabdochlamydia sp.]|jgi:hypothetical protein|nr:hypothetical protein [Candidatus Rhabdochlamydia sp.]
MQKLFYEPTGLTIQKLKAEDESADYAATEFEINNQNIKFRLICL